MWRQHPLLRLIVVVCLLAPALLAGSLSPPHADQRLAAAQEATATETITLDPTVEPTEPATETPTPDSTQEPAEPTSTDEPTPPPETPTPTPTETSTPEPTATPDATEPPTPTLEATPTTGPAAVTTPRLTIAKNAGHVGEMLGVGITGFPPSTRVAIYFDGARKVTLTTGTTGVASGSIRIPAATAGLHEIKAKGGGKIALKNFRVSPVFKLSDSTVIAGGPVTVTLTGFAATSLTKIRLYEINGSTVVLSVWALTTDATGGARQTFTTKTTLTAGKHLVIATDAQKNSRSAYLTTSPYRPAPPEPDDPAVSQLYYRGTSGRREVALTFDLDADRGYAEYVLDVLKANGVKATFGVAGYWASANPDLIRRMVAEGHQIINHSMTHPSFTGAVAGEVAVLSRDARLGELYAQDAVISRITGGYVQEPYWRPPYGDFNTSVLIDVAAGGYTATIMWTCDTMGWYGASAAQIISTCGYGAAAGDIILMHPSSRSMDGPALPDLIAVLRSRGFAFATVERILQ